LGGFARLLGQLVAVDRAIANGLGRAKFGLPFQQGQRKIWR
jgi:hypothetical protein